MVIKVLSSISTYVWRQLFLSASLRFNTARLKMGHMLYLGMLPCHFTERDSSHCAELANASLEQSSGNLPPIQGSPYSPRGLPWGA